MPKILDFEPVAGPPGRRPSRAFSLIEVVVALGVFSVAIVVVVGLLKPTVSAVQNVVDSQAAGRLADSIQEKLATYGYTALTIGDPTTNNQPLLITSSANMDTSVALNDPRLLYADRTGDVVGMATGPDAGLWLALNPTAPNDSMYYEIMLVRNSTFSPPSNTLDALAGGVAFTVHISWPAYLPGSTAGGLQPLPRIERHFYNFQMVLPR
jgi:prepilin-type N-terminal cleavage/methylation domain-containing protein